MSSRTARPVMQPTLSMPQRWAPVWVFMVWAAKPLNTWSW